MVNRFRNYSLFIIGSWLLVFLIAGCAEITPPNPIDVIKHPFSGNKPELRIGLKKSEVKAYWGEPDEVVPLGATKLGAAGEKWVYYGQITDVPIDYRYLSKTKRLYFEGDVLTKWESD